VEGPSEDRVLERAQSIAAAIGAALSE
jgi:hypothetical protein